MISFLLGIAVVVRKSYQSEDEIDIHRKVEPKEVQRNELELLDWAISEPQLTTGLVIWINKLP